MAIKKVQKRRVFLTVVAVIEAKKGFERRVRKELQRLIEPTKVEKGCVDYELHVKAENPRVFLFYENWISKTFLDKHLASDHLKCFDQSCRGLLAKPVSITLWRRVA